jgi:hypothetical protein
MHKSSPVVISFYTLDTPYGQEVFRCKQSCEQLKIDAVIEEIPSQGSRELNAAFKPQFILQKIEELKRAVLWVEPTYHFVKKPKWSDYKKCDLSVGIDELLSGNHPARIHSGAIFVNHTPEAISLLKEWIQECKEHLPLKDRLSAFFKSHRPFWEQQALNEILLSNKNAKIKNLMLENIIKQNSQEEIQ